ncbi:TPA: hypothetical protein JZG45_004862 [Escherichia coli]|nr:hypothetical protein [Escherichia coli]
MNKTKYEASNSCLNQFLIHRLKLMLLYICMLYVPAASATYDFLLWKKKDGSTGEISYSGARVDSVIGKVSSVYTGTMEVSYKECTMESSTTVKARGEARWFFLPKKVTINGQSVAISVYSVPSSYVLSSYGNDYWMLKFDNGIDDSVSEADRYCSKYTIGKTYNMTYYYPSFQIKLGVSGLSSGSYTGNIPVKLAYAEHFATSASEIIKLSDDSAFDNVSVVNIPYEINISNACTITPESISLDHGSSFMGEAEGKSVQNTMFINCDEPASVAVTLKSRDVPSPATSYSDGVGVSLGNGWVSELTICDSGLSDVSSTGGIISISESSLSCPIISTLRKNGTVTAGSISGSLVISLEIK